MEQSVEDKRQLFKQFKAFSLENNKVAMELLSQNHSSLALNKLKQVHLVYKQFRDDHAQQQLQKQLLPLVALTNNNMACIYRRKKKLFSAMKLLEKALNIQKKLDQKELQAQTLINMGVVSQQLNKVDHAVQLFNQSLQLLADKKTDSAQRLRSLVNYNLGCSYLRKNQRNQVIKYSQKGGGPLFQALKSAASKNISSKTRTRVSSVRTTFNKRPTSPISNLIRPMTNQIPVRSQREGLRSEPRRRVSLIKQGQQNLYAVRVHLQRERSARR